MGHRARMAPTRRRTKPRISCPPGPQHGRHKTSLAVEDDDWLKTVIVMKGIEQAQLLAAVHAVEGVVDIEHDALGHLPERGAVLLDQRPAEAQQRPHIRQVFQPRDPRIKYEDRLRAQFLIRGQSVQRQLEHRIAAQRCTTFSGVRGSLRPPARRSANPSRRSTSRKTSNPPSDDGRPPSKRATTALP